MNRLVLLDTPPGTRVLVDFFEWTCGEHFLGVRSLCDGVHVCAVLHSAAPVLFWFRLGPHVGRVCVRRWDRAAESFAQDDDQSVRAAAERGEMDRRMRQHNQEEDDENDKQNVRHRPGWHDCTSMLQLRSELCTEPTASAWGSRSGRTRQFDRSDELRKAEPEIVLAWMQRAYLEMVLAHSVEAFEVWRDAVVLFCGCVQALRERPEIFIVLAKTLRWQFLEAGSEILWQDSNGSKNILLASVSNFIEDVRSDSDLPPNLKAVVEHLSVVVPSAQPDDDDMPVIVEDEM